MTIKRLTYRKQRKMPPVLLHGGSKRSSADREPPELLTGEVKGFKASAGEERAANALYKNPKISDFFFRLTIGAERNMPGFKELDLLVETTSGLWYAIEVDSAFTHRSKGTSDVLHDAIVLENLKSLNVFPKVIHLDIDQDLPDQRTADRTIKQLVG